MKTLKRVLLLAVAALCIVTAIVLWRTVTYRAPAAADYSGVKLAPAPAFDLATAAAHLGEAIGFQTVSHQDAQSDWSQWDGLHAWLQATYPTAHQAMTREVVAGHSLLYTWPGSDASLPPVMLMAHQDVVPVIDPAKWSKPPFDGVVADGSVWGRGAVDDKGSMIALMESVEALAKSGFKPRRTVMIFNGHDEEVGQTGAKTAAALLKQRGIKLQFVLDEGQITLKKFPILPGPAALIGVSEKGHASLKITAEGEGGHSSMPPSETSVQILARAVLAIADNQDPLILDGPGAETIKVLAPDASFVIRMAIANQWLFNRQLIGTISATPAGAALLHTTTAPTMLTGSPKENVLPQSATAVVNYRIKPGQTANDVMARAKDTVAGMPVSLQFIGKPRDPSPVSSTTSGGWKILASLASDDGATPVAPSLVLAGTDSYHMTGVATDVYRYQPLRLGLDEVGMIHGTDEHMTLDNLKRMIDFYARLIATASAQ